MDRKATLLKPFGATFAVEAQGRASSSQLKFTTTRMLTGCEDFECDVFHYEGDGMSRV